VAPARAARPHDVVAPARVAPAPEDDSPVPGCPFCPGNEGLTPPERAARRPGGSAPDRPGWAVRVVPNRFPAVDPEDGVHEVVVTTPRHVALLGRVRPGEAADALDVWAERLRVVEADRRGLWPFAFLNQGALGGASLQHTHAQVVGIPFAPPRLVERARGFAGAPRCPVCAELEDPGDRVLATAGGLVAWFPAVPSLSGALRIAPADHLPDWEERPGAALGPLLVRAAAAVCAAAGTDALNVWVHRAPPGGMSAYHWHLELVPRLGTLAGLELGAGVLALTRDPSELAARARAADAAAAGG